MIISVFIFGDFGRSSSIVITRSPKCRKNCCCFASLSCPFLMCWVADLLQKRCWQWEEQQETWHFTAGWCAVNHGRVKLARFTMENMARTYGIHTATHLWKSCFASHLSVQVLKFHDTYYKSLQVRFFGTLQQKPSSNFGVNFKVVWILTSASFFCSKIPCQGLDARET